MLKFLNKKKNDNKGFSLVELIIVVAILAILVGLLAPQYLKYVEKSRKSADASNLDEMVRAIQVYAADAEVTLSLIHIYIICNYAEPCRFSIKRRGTMAVEGTKIKEMMEGKTLEKDNIKKMYDMVQKMCIRDRHIMRRSMTLNLLKNIIII